MITISYNIERDIDKLAAYVVQLLRMRKLTLTTAESCTGGMLAGAITSAAGSSAVFGLGRVVYSNDFKMSELSVKEETLRKHGAVSAQTALEMAEGARLSAKADIGISITGIAGPEGGSREKPVGTVHFTCVCKERVLQLHLAIDASHLATDERRRFIRQESVRQALILISEIII